MAWTRNTCEEAVWWPTVYTNIDLWWFQLNDVSLTLASSKARHFIWFWNSRIRQLPETPTSFLPQAILYLPILRAVGSLASPTDLFISEYIMEVGSLQAQSSLFIVKYISSSSSLLIIMFNNLSYSEEPATPNFVYPYGATLTVKKPAAAILSSSDVCYPVKRPVAALYTSEKSGGTSSFWF